MPKISLTTKKSGFQCLVQLDCRVEECGKEIQELLYLTFQAATPHCEVSAILNLTFKKGHGACLTRMSAAGMLPSSPQGWVYGVPRQTLPMS